MSAAENLILFAVQHGVAVPLYRRTDDAITDLIECLGDAYALEVASVAQVGDGIWVCRVFLMDAGPGDAPGSREVELVSADVRPPTPEEWGHYVADEHIWSIPEAAR